MKQLSAWINGEYVDWEDAGLSLADTGLVHGDSVTEMLRTFAHEPFRISQHLSRFRHSLSGALLDCPWSDEQLSEVITTLVDRSTESLDRTTDLGMILFATGGPNITYVGKEFDLTPTICVHTFPLHFELWRDSLRTGQHLVVAPLQAIPPECMDPTIKTRSRMHWRIGDRLVKRNHPKATAVFADAAGNLTETSSANLFVFKEGKILSPPSGRVLNGISRQVVMELAEAAGYTVKEQMIPIELALEGDEIWTTSTPYCMLPVTKLNETTISGGEPGPVFGQILKAWSDLVGVDLREQMLRAD